MAFVVEDGTGKPDANSYIDVAYYRSYFADRGIDVTADTDPKIQGWCVQATDYIETRFHDRLKGCPKTQTQALHFPADGVYIGFHLQDPDTLPVNLLKAAAEYARRVKSGPLMPDPVTDETGQGLAGKREKVGPLEDEFTYVPGGAINLIKPYPAADKLMASLVTGRGGLIRN